VETDVVTDATKLNATAGPATARKIATADEVVIAAAAAVGAQKAARAPRNPETAQAPPFKAVAGKPLGIATAENTVAAASVTSVPSRASHVNQQFRWNQLNWKA
jgi:hypothetical protein